MSRLAGIALLLLLLASCSGAATEPPPDPLTLVRQAAENVRQTTSFRMLVERTGAPYYVDTDLGKVAVRRVQAEYIAPDVMQAQVRLAASGIPAVVDVFSRGYDQWFRNSILTANRWLNAPFALGFNPEILIAQETGIQAALQAMVDLSYIGVETLEDGSPAHHLKATANGDAMSALLVGLIVMTGTVDVDVYIHTETHLPVRFVIVQPDTVTDEELEPTTWTMDIYDFNQPMTIDDPEATAAPESTAEATQDAGG